ncbi:hypothetical protein [Streptomyces sp. MP131-18]|uniref:hypothetical protein n=1 Tax=Streptomyces sp. MP131-18 TaxID=1857892 RepID=UPI00097C5C55|nr:hypothetical protein [Streptomyces sp. MP131-18]ONK15211.1 hypothetical protein STBA_60260 [Streptomyces sp. MP131-18]
MSIPTGFQEPGTDDHGKETEITDGRNAAAAGPETISFTLDGEQFTVSGFERSLPGMSSAGARAQLVRAGLTAEGTSLDEDAWHAVARAVVTPDAAAAQLRAQKGEPSALVEEHVEGATLRSLHTRAWLTELFPGLQPRTGQGNFSKFDPEVYGEVDEAGHPRAAVRYHYRDRAHLHAHLKETIVATRNANPEPYDRSILARRITRAVIAHPARLTFADGTEPVDVLLVRDGITRLTSAWALLTEDQPPHADDIAETAVGILLAEKPQRRGAAEKALSQRMALGRQDALSGLQAEFHQGLGSVQPADRSVRLRQTLVVPAQIMVGFRRHGSAALAARDAFDDAVRSILASVHVEFRAWEPAAQNVEVGSRAISRVVLPDLPSDNLIDGYTGLALGRRQPEGLPEIFQDKGFPPTPLWRAVLLVHFLTRPDVYEQVKRYAKAIKGTKKMSDSGYAELLGPVVDLPWRPAKTGSLKQARNAWANGGVLTKAVLGEWEPMPCGDFTELVGPALRGNQDARQTLAVAGGTALIADKLLTRNVGSAVGRTVPFRANVDKVIAGLSESEEGLWILAFAAQSFDAARECLNSFTKAQLMGRKVARMYTVPAVDLTAADKRLRDRGGVAEEPLDPWRVVEASNPEMALRAKEEARQSDTSGPERPIGDRLAGERRALRTAVREAREAVERLLGLAETPEALATTQDPFGSDDEVNRLIDEVRRLAGTIMVHRSTPDAATDDDEEAEEPLTD